MEFREGRGFVGMANPTLPVIADLAQIVTGIIRENPQINGTNIKTLAKPYGIGKNAMDEILKTGDFVVEPGNGRERRYSARDGPISLIPGP